MDTAGSLFSSGKVGAVSAVPHFMGHHTGKEGTPILVPLSEIKVKPGKRLNDEKLSTPAQYRRETGQLKTDRYENARWNIQTLKAIVENQVYIGHLVQGRKKSGLCQGRKQQRIQKSDWIVVENTHEPLIDEDTFQAVQAMAEKASQIHNTSLGRYDHLGSTPNILRGLIFLRGLRQTSGALQASHQQGYKPLLYLHLPDPSC